MRKILVFLVLVLSLSTSCVLEPPTTRYSFRIINRTSNVLYVNYKTIKYDKVGLDTIKPEQVFEKNILQLTCYQNFHDTIIHSFFTNLKICLENKSINIDTYNSSNWKDSISLSGLGNCKGGTAYFTLEVKEMDCQ